MLNLANGFSAAGRNVDLVLSETKGEFLSHVSASVRLVDLKSPGGVLRSLPAFRRYLRREEPAILLSAMDYINVLSVLLRATVWRRPRLFISCHNSVLNSSRNSPWARDRLLPFSMRITYRFADGVIAVSDGVAKTLAEVTRLPRERIKVLHNPVVTMDFEKHAAAPLDHPWFEAGQPPIILGVGSLVVQKDFATLIRAFALARERIPIRLLILGEGEERAALTRLADELGVEEDVAMPGWIANPYAYMARADLFALSSLWEGFGLVVAEALACGTPVVSTDCPSGPAEILDGGEYGTLVPPRDENAMASAILNALSQPPDRATLKRRGYSFAAESVASEYLKYFDSIGNSATAVT